MHRRKQRLLHHRLHRRNEQQHPFQKHRPGQRSPGKAQRQHKRRHEHLHKPGDPQKRLLHNAGRRAESLHENRQQQHIHHVVAHFRNLPVLENIGKTGEGGRDQGDHHHMDQCGFVGLPFREQIVRQKLLKKQQPVPDTALQKRLDHIQKMHVRLLIHLLQKSVDLRKIQLFQKRVRIVGSLVLPEIGGRGSGSCDIGWHELPGGSCFCRKHWNKKQKYAQQQPQPSPSLHSSFSAYLCFPDHFCLNIRHESGPLTFLTHFCLSLSLSPRILALSFFYSTNISFLFPCSTPPRKDSCLYSAFHIPRNPLMVSSSDSRIGILTARIVSFPNTSIWLAMA